MVTIFDNLSTACDKRMKPRKKVVQQKINSLFILNCTFMLYTLDVDEYVLKAQVLAGGRGKGHFSNGFKGGVHVTKE